ASSCSPARRLKRGRRSSRDRRFGSRRSAGANRGFCSPSVVAVPVVRARAERVAVYEGFERTPSEGAAGGDTRGVGLAAADFVVHLGAGKTDDERECQEQGDNGDEITGGHLQAVAPDR